MPSIFRPPVPGQMPWMRMLGQVSLALAIVALVGTIGGVFISGNGAAGGFILGLGLVYLSFLVAITVVVVAERRSMGDAARALVASYVVKILLFTALLILVPIPEAYRNGWMLAGAVLALVIQLALETKIIMKQRLFYFDSVG